MLAMQLLGWHAYLLYNALGSPMYPEGTNHFWPSSPLFKPQERGSVIASNVGLSVMTSVLTYYIREAGIGMFVKMYFIPYLVRPPTPYTYLCVCARTNAHGQLANHWIVMLTFLHHSDPSIPHYRSKEWSFLRGAVATIDRPLLGWAGRFFLHNVSHDHIAHHFFSSIPFCESSRFWVRVWACVGCLLMGFWCVCGCVRVDNQPYVTEAIKGVLGEDYNYDSTVSAHILPPSFLPPSLPPLRPLLLHIYHPPYPPIHPSRRTRMRPYSSFGFGFGF